MSRATTGSMILCVIDNRQMSTKATAKKVGA